VTRTARAAALGALFLVVAIVMVFPSIDQWRAAIPGDYGDAFFSQWLLQWNVRGLFSGAESVFHPNMFWPARNTLVYSDTELAAAPLAALLDPIVGWPVAYNVIYLGTWVFSQVATYLLARWVGASRAAAVLAAFIFSFAAVRLGHFGHFPMLFGCLAPIVVYLLLRFLVERRWWQAVAFGLSGAAIFLNAGYIALVLAFLLAVVVAGWLVATRFKPEPRTYAGLGLAALVVLVLLFPALRVYREEAEFLTRPYVHAYAVTPKNFLSPAVGTWLYGPLERRFNSEFENKLFPGFLAVGLGIIGGAALWSTRRKPPSEDEPQLLRRRGLLLVLLGTLPALVLAFGKYQFVAGRKVPLPYTLFGLLPGLRSIRAFGRFTVIPVLGLALVAAVGFDRLVRNRRTAVRIALAIAFGVVLLAEYKARIGMAPRVDKAELTAVNRALARLPDGPVVELPMGDTRGPYWAYVEAPRLQLTTIDWKPRVNGYSGYSPPGYERSIDLFNGLAKGGPASPEALARLDELGVRYVVIRTKPVDPNMTGPGIAFEDEAAADRIVASLPAERVERVSREGAAVLVQLRSARASPAPLPPGVPPLPTLPPLPPGVTSRP
jgi:hypothetical protein